ncbi:hypothetical protein F4819DRAFT_491163 [Hypoxylon fuscum]|nr:hypothetical protein F4819DRAFT_491163 [Hypoxylon fuscum]
MIRGAAAAADLSAGRKDLPSHTIDIWKLDLSAYGSVVTFAERAAKTFTRLDIAILNAGICPTKRVVNPSTSHDEIIQVNYLFPALLIILFLLVAKAFLVDNPLPILAALDAPGEAANNTTDRMFVYKLLGQYFISKLASLLPTSVAVINSASPGSVYDSQFSREIQSDTDKTPAGQIIKMILRRVGNSSAVGARMITDAAIQHR